MKLENEPLEEEIPNLGTISFRFQPLAFRVYTDGYYKKVKQQQLFLSDDPGLVRCRQLHHLQCSKSRKNERFKPQQYGLLTMFLFLKMKVVGSHGSC